MKRKLIGIIIISIFLFGIIVPEIYYQITVSKIVKQIEIETLTHYELFNKSICLIEVGDKINMKPMSKFELFHQIIFFRDSQKSFQRRVKKGWIFAEQTSAYLISKNKLYRNMGEWHLFNYLFTIWITRNWDVDKCLDILVNNSYYGNEYRGLESASFGYYRKSPEQLNVNETAFLVYKFLYNNNDRFIDKVDEYIDILK